MQQTTANGTAILKLDQALNQTNGATNMKRTIIAVSIALASSTAMAGSYEQYFGGQEGVNKHLQGSINDMQDFDRHLQGSINDDRKRITANEQWNDRQEGVIRQNRGRLDGHDQQIGLIQEAQTVTDQRSINNAVRLDGAEGAIRETNAQVEVTDARSIDNAKRHDVATNERGRIESESVQRDNVLSQQAQTNMSWSIDQFNRQSQALSGVKAGVESNRQAIDDERAERKEMGKDLEAGVASAMAAAAVQFDPSYDGFQMSIAGGAYRGASASHLAVGTKVSDSVFLSGGASHDSRGNQAYNASANFKF